MRTVIFDIDGTLADVSHRRHHVAQKPKRWDLFFAELVNDPPVDKVVEFCQFMLKVRYAKVIFCTGRGEEYRAETEAWLVKHVAPFVPLGDTKYLHQPQLDLRMRPAKDSRPDDIIKKEMLDQLRAEGHDIWFAVDDRERVVQMWRKNGVTVFQCAPGDFDNGDPYYYEAKPGECLLTLMVGPSGSGKSTKADSLRFSRDMPEDSVLSSDRVRQDMLGDFRDQSANERVFAYIHDTIKTRMRYGLPTIVDATHLHKRDRLASAVLAPEGTVVEYIVVDRPLADKMRDGGWRLDVKIDGMTLIEKHHQRMRGSLKDILAGDGLGNVRVTDMRRTN